MKAEATVVQIDMDYRTVGKNRDISLGLAGDVGAILKAVADAANGRIDNGAAGRQEWLDELRAAEGVATEKLTGIFKSDKTPINPYRVAWELNEFLTEDTIYIGDDVTDEDAFMEINEELKDELGVGILVSSAPKVSAAKFSLRETSEVLKFLTKLHELGDKGEIRTLG